jgi:hypothetical protein
MEVLLVTNLISLTPGTLSLDVTDDCNTLLIHAMFADDPDAIRKQMKTGHGALGDRGDGVGPWTFWQFHSTCPSCW